AARPPATTGPTSGRGSSRPAPQRVSSHFGRLAGCRVSCNLRVSGGCGLAKTGITRAAARYLTNERNCLYYKALRSIVAVADVGRRSWVLVPHMAINAELA